MIDVTDDKLAYCRLSRRPVEPKNDFLGFGSFHCLCSCRICKAFQGLEFAERYWNELQYEPGIERLKRLTVL